MENKVYKISIIWKVRNEKIKEFKIKIIPSCTQSLWRLNICFVFVPGRVAQSEAPLNQEPEVLGSIPGLVTYFR